jgi:hypothetical protein
MRENSKNQTHGRDVLIPPFNRKRSVLIVSVRQGARTEYVKNKELNSFCGDQFYPFVYLWIRREW